MGWHRQVTVIKQIDPKNVRKMLTLITMEYMTISEVELLAQAADCNRKRAEVVNVSTWRLSFRT